MVRHPPGTLVSANAAVVVLATAVDVVLHVNWTGYGWRSACNGSSFA